MKRMLLGWIRWKTCFPTFSAQGKIPVWLSFFNYGDGYIVEAFFTDLNSPLEPIGAIISNLHTIQIVKSFESPRIEYVKYRLFIFHDKSMTRHQLKKELLRLWGFKAKTKYVYVKFEPRLELENVLLGFFMQMV